MFEFVWYILSPLTWLSSFPLSRNDTQDDNDDFVKIDSLNKPKMKSVNIPYYFQGENEDSIDLQIKSLVYVFHKLKISNLKPFLKINPLTDEYEFDYLDNNSHNISSHNKSTKGILMNDKLDRIYNVEHFKKQLINDPYRILIDYNKNKFRSLLILTGLPKEFDELPTLNTPNFNFLVLKPNDTIERFIETIVYKSGIYSEHRINNKIKTQILLRIINRHKKLNEMNDIKEFSKDDRADIIKSYVQKLSFYIQVQRIYKATLKSKERDLKNKLVKYSNDKSIQSYKNLKSERSRMILLPDLATSPSKNNLNNSSTPISIMDLDDVSNPNNSDCHYYSDTGESQASSSTSSVNFTKFFSEEEKHVCFEQSKMAVRIRIERERNLMMF